MSATLVQLFGDADGFQRLFCPAEGFLLGPQGEVWDLYPRLGYAPRLLVVNRDGSPSIAYTDEATASLLRFRITHAGRYLQAQAVTDALEPGVPLWEARNGRFVLCERDGEPTLIDLARTERGEAKQIAALGAERWVGAAVSSYLLVAARNTDAKLLLGFARRFDLPRAERMVSPRLLAPPPRARLSPLAELARQRLGLALG